MSGTKDSRPAYLWHTESMGQPMHAMDYELRWFDDMPVYGRTVEEATSHLGPRQRLKRLADGSYDREEVR